MSVRLSRHALLLVGSFLFALLCARFWIMPNIAQYHGLRASCQDVESRTRHIETLLQTPLHLDAFLAALDELPCFESHVVHTPTNPTNSIKNQGTSVAISDKANTAHSNDNRMPGITLVLRAPSPQEQSSLLSLLDRIGYAIHTVVYQENRMTLQIGPLR